MGHKGLNPRRILNELHVPTIHLPTPQVSSAHSTTPMRRTCNLITSPHPLPSQNVQTTLSHHPSNPLPLTPPNYSPPLELIYTHQWTCQSSFHYMILLLIKSQFQTEEAKLLLNSTVTANFDHATLCCNRIFN